MHVVPTSSLTATPSSRARSRSYSLSNGSAIAPRRLHTRGLGLAKLGVHLALRDAEGRAGDLEASAQIPLLLLRDGELRRDRLGQLHDLEKVVLERPLPASQRVALVRERLQLTRHGSGGKLPVDLAALLLDRGHLVLQPLLAAGEIGVAARQLLELGFHIGQRRFERVDIGALGQMGPTVTKLIETSVGVLEREEIGLQRHGESVVGAPPP